MRLAGAKNYRDYSLKILKFVKKNRFHSRFFADNPKEMLKQVYKINSWGKKCLCKNTSCKF